MTACTEGSFQVYYPASHYRKAITLTALRFWIVSWMQEGCNRGPANERAQTL